MLCEESSAGFGGNLSRIIRKGMWLEGAASVAKTKVRRTARIVLYFAHPNLLREEKLNGDNDFEGTKKI